MTVRNVLFVMADQMRWDAMSCANPGLPIATPHLDALARRGVRFDRAYAQGATCGSSRASFYSGRYVLSHGARYNNVPLSLTTPTLADHLAPLGVGTHLIGKTHSVLDTHGAALLGLAPDSPAAALRADAGFRRVVRHEGLVPIGSPNEGTTPYDRHLRAHGFDAPNPWHDLANSGRRPDGTVVSGWTMDSGPLPALIPDELSETAWTTDLAVDFMRDQGDTPWCLHLSYIKPHWPYVVSDPYHAMVDPADLGTPNRSVAELGAHPATTAFQQMRISRNFSDDTARRGVHTAYLGLVAQLDFHLGRLWKAMDELGRTGDTMIVFTSDHGDYMGDHWLGEKDYVHDESVRIPMIVVDPSPAADATRGTVATEPVESIDLIPTFIEALAPGASGAGPTTSDNWLEGRSLLGDLAGRPAAERVAISEADYGFREMRDQLPGCALRDLRVVSVATTRWKYFEHELFEPQLFDLDADPGELVDLGTDPGYTHVRSELEGVLHDWRRNRLLDPISHARRLSGPATGAVVDRGIPIGFRDGAELDQQRAHNRSRSEGTPP